MYHLTIDRFLTTNNCHAVNKTVRVFEFRFRFFGNDTTKIMSFYSVALIAGTFNMLRHCYGESTINCLRGVSLRLYVGNLEWYLLTCMDLQDHEYNQI